MIGIGRFADHIFYRATAVIALLGAGCAPSVESLESSEAPDVTFSIATPELVLDTLPLLTVGGKRDQQAGHALHLVRYAVLLGSNRLALANGGSKTIRFFDASGVLLREAGGPGEGPGEFALLSSLHRWKSDSIAAWDAQLRRVTLFDSEGNRGRVIAIQSDSIEHVRSRGWPPFFLYPLFDEGFVVVHGERSTSRKKGLIREQMRVAIVDRTGAASRYVGDFDGTELLDGTFPVPFSFRFRAATTSNALYIGNGRGADLVEYSGDGTRSRIIRLPIIREHISAADRKRANEAYLDKNVRPQQRSQIEELLNQTAIVDSFPAFTAIVGTGDDLWVELYELPSQPRVWLKVNPADQVARQLRLPVGATVLDAKGNLLAVLAKDELGREEIRVHRVTSGKSL